MNQLEAKISEIKTEGSMSLVKVMVQDCTITSIVINNADLANQLITGNSIKVLFKETEVMLAKGFSGAISIQNKLDCTVSSFEKGELLCKIKLQFQNTSISSVITRNAFDQLNIQEDDVVLAMIKTNEVSLAPHD
ncbi:MAG TPA: TOBE domain-containing protein [Flavobacterium sp.]|nr:TOBE domain-containing protein [Flavobacterium sp.]